MCINLPSKTLNPQAKEWEPTPKPYPLPPPRQPAAFNPLPPPRQPAAFNPLPPPRHPAAFNPLPPPPHYYPNYNVNVPLYVVSFPATLVFTPHKAKTVAKPKFTRSTKTKKMESPELKSPKCPSTAHFVNDKGFKKALPPRLLRLRKCYSTVNNPPPPQKQCWRPKANSKVSGEGGAGHIPPPTLSGRHRSLPGNTTVMIKNIPNQLRKHFLLSFLDDYCKNHELEYDFLYLPMDFRKKDNLGYAFVNFTTSVAAQKFKDILQGYKWASFFCQGRVFTSKKVCVITWARIQGVKALVERFKNSSFQCDRLDYLPVILDPPRNGCDPDPSAPVILGSLQQQAMKGKLVTDV